MARASAQARLPGVEIAPAGESAIIVRLGADISPATHARVMALLRALDLAPPAGLRDLVPAYATLLVLFDPLKTTLAAIEAHLRLALRTMRARARATSGRLVRIPVYYGGAEGPDLAEVAHQVGLTPAEVVRLHAAAEYRVYFLGFQAGFPYLGGLPAELSVPRLTNPRASVPAGSVGLAGQQTGIYPVSTPGGWRIIGRTPLRLFDPAGNPPALLRPGDRLRFEPMCQSQADDVENAGLVAGGDAGGAPRPATTRRSARGAATETATERVAWLRVRNPGLLATVQDLGRHGYARYGISASGAADADALMLGNALLGNPPGAAGLELTLGGAEFEVLAPCMVALTGADCVVRVGGGELRPGVVAAVESGDVIQVGVARRGARGYLCVAGGIEMSAALGSRSTDLRAGLGGIEGRPSRPDDVLMRGVQSISVSLVSGRRLPPDPVRRLPANGTWRIRILAGPQASRAPGDLDALLAGTYVVDPRSDRVGVRLQTMSRSGGQPMTGGEILSEGVPRGAVQVPANGEPIILLADHQTTGGYRVPAVVAGADLWRVAQLRPKDTVRFALVTHDAALAALRSRQEWLDQVAASFSGSASAATLRQGVPEVDRLMSGFAEWSEETCDEA